jgi:elongation factor Ts
MEVDIELVKKLREETGISLGDCKKAVEAANGDIEKAKEYLKERGQAVAAKKTERVVNSGIIKTYVHSNKRIGVMLEINCETDFVARSEDFENLAHEICLQIISMKPLYVRDAEMPEDASDKDACLMNQLWIKDGSKTIQILINETIAKTGENIVVKRFVIYEF